MVHLTEIIQILFELNTLASKPYGGWWQTPCRFAILYRWLTSNDGLRFVLGFLPNMEKIPEKMERGSHMVNYGCGVLQIFFTWLFSWGSLTKIR